MPANKNAISGKAGYHRCHGEARALIGAQLKSASDVSVWRVKSTMSGSSSAIGIICFECSRTPEHPACRARVPKRVRSELPGIKLTTYGTQGSPWEHGNPQSSAGTKTSGKPPSPAMSRRGGRVLVVVGARESRVRDEGGQSMSMAARPLG